MSKDRSNVNSDNVKSNNVNSDNITEDDSQECTHNCDTCGLNCSSREKTGDGGQGSESFRVPLNKASSVKNVIGIVSGKGGVGKSLVTTMLAVRTRLLRKNVGIIDADITGPSIPRAFGLSDKITATEEGLMIPAATRSGIQVISSNLLLDHDTDPIIWRGPVIAGGVRQFWSDTYWDDIDYMYVDMPPGTGDVPLTVFQSLPVNGIVIVTSPQELVSMIVTKAIRMAEEMNIPVYGIIENMSYFECPDCGARHEIFGESNIDEVAKAAGIPVLARIPIDPKIAAAIDNGQAELLKADWLDDAVKAIVKD